MYKWVWHIVALLTEVLNDTDQTVHIFGILSVKRQTLASLKQHFFLPLNGFKKNKSVNCTFLRLKKKINKKKFKFLVHLYKRTKTLNITFNKSSR